MNEIVIKDVKSKTIKLSVLAILMTSASLFNIYIGIKNDTNSYVMTGFIGLFFFGYASIYLIIRSAKQFSESKDNFIIKINDNGITDYSTKVGGGLIKWADIKSAKVSRVFFQKFISLELHDEEAFYNNMEKHGEISKKLNKFMKNSPISLSLQTANISEEKLLEYINDRIN